MFYTELTEKKVYILPEQVFFPCVPMPADHILDIADSVFVFKDLFHV